jgi:hypothetical protein
MGGVKVAKLIVRIERGKKGFIPLFKISSPVLGNLDGKWIRLTPLEDLEHEYPLMAGAQDAVKQKVPVYLERVYLREMAAGHEGGMIGKAPASLEDQEAKYRKRWEEYIDKMTNAVKKKSKAKRNISHTTRYN